MRQGTTWPHKFKIPFSTSMLKSVQVVYAQGSNILFRKTIGDCILSGREVQLSLSQKETLKLDPKKELQLQLRLLTTDDVAFASNIFITGVEPSLDGEVLA